MKEFNTTKFCCDLLDLRGTKTQEKFAKEIGVNRSTLSLLESGNQLPTMKQFSKFCELRSASTEEYFFDTVTDSLVFLMGSLSEADKAKINEMSERIHIREKYELLAGRG